MPEINETEELPEGTLSINQKLIQKYQHLEPSIRPEYKDGTPFERPTPALRA